MRLEPILNDTENPLVSILVYNYNYGRYLRQCLESIFAQTYNNIEICFSDNASTDDSWVIAREFIEKYPGVMTVTCNRKNFGMGANASNCFVGIHGKYFYRLCSDDVLHPECIEACVRALEQHSEAGFSLVHHDHIDGAGEHKTRVPFLSESCVVPHPIESTAVVISEVNEDPMHIMYRVGLFNAKPDPDERVRAFRLCCEHPLIYINEPLLLRRVHGQSQSALSLDKLTRILDPYMVQYKILKASEEFDLSGSAERFLDATRSLSALCLMVSIRLLEDGREYQARRYHFLSAALLPETVETSTYRLLEDFWASAVDKDELMAKCREKRILAPREHAHEPPAGSVPIDLKKMRCLHVTRDI